MKKQLENIVKMRSISQSKNLVKKPSKNFVNRSIKPQTLSDKNLDSLFKNKLLFVSGGWRTTSSFVVLSGNVRYQPPSSLTSSTQPPCSLTSSTQSPSSTTSSIRSPSSTTSSSRPQSSPSSSSTRRFNPNESLPVFPMCSLRSSSQLMVPEAVSLTRTSAYLNYDLLLKDKDLFLLNDLFAPSLCPGLATQLSPFSSSLKSQVSSRLKSTGWTILFKCIIIYASSCVLVYCNVIYIVVVKFKLFSSSAVSV